MVEFNFCKEHFTVKKKYFEREANSADTFVRTSVTSPDMIDIFDSSIDLVCRKSFDNNKCTDDRSMEVKLPAF